MLTIAVGYSLVEKEKGKRTRYANRTVTGLLENAASVGDFEYQLLGLYEEIRALIETNAEQARAAEDSQEEKG